MYISLDRLKEGNPALHRAVIAHLGFIEGIRQIEPSDFPAPIARKLRSWVETQRLPAPVSAPEFQKRLDEFQSQNATPPAPEPEPAAPTITPLPAGGDFDMAVYEREQLQMATDQARGESRIEQYANEQGLERTPENASAIKQWLEENLKGYLSEQGVDAAIQWLGPKGKNVLTWRAKAEPTPPEPEPAGEILQDWQLPLTATEQQMKSASVAALKDLIARRRSATNQQYIRRGFSSTF